MIIFNWLMIEWVSKQAMEISHSKRKTRAPALCHCKYCNFARAASAMFGLFLATPASHLGHSPRAFPYDKWQKNTFSINNPPRLTKSTCSWFAKGYAEILSSEWGAEEDAQVMRWTHSYVAMRMGWHFLLCNFISVCIHNSLAAAAAAAKSDCINGKILISTDLYGSCAMCDTFDLFPANRWRSTCCLRAGAPLLICFCVCVCVCLTLLLFSRARARLIDFMGALEKYCSCLYAEIIPFTINTLNNMSRW